MYFLGFVIVYNLGMYAFMIYLVFGKKCYKSDEDYLLQYSSKFYPLSALMFIGSLVYAIFSLQYIRLLEKSDCKCALTGYGDEVLKIHSIIVLVAYGIVFTMLIVIPLIVLFSFRKNMLRLKK